MLPFSVFITVDYLNIYIVFAIFLILWIIIPFIRGYFLKKINKDDVQNIAIGISKSSELEKLYKKLIVLVHPDKNLDKIDIAIEYTQLLNDNRYNYAQLKELEEKIKTTF